VFLTGNIAKRPACSPCWTARSSSCGTVAAPRTAEMLLELGNRQRFVRRELDRMPIHWPIEH
jgi:hypothetical protein